jgi:hypothetical protein
MPKPLELALDEKTERPELEKIRDHHPKPYVRERAAAILKIAGGLSGREVALHGLLKPRCPDSIYDWVRDYQAEGVAGLLVKPGRGRKPVFTPERVTIALRKYSVDGHDHETHRASLMPPVRWPGRGANCTDPAIQTDGVLRNREECHER